MPEGKHIEIKIAATGGDQAAAEIGKVTDAEEHLGQGGGDAAGPESLEQRMDALKKRAEGLRENADETQNLGDKTREMGDETERTGPKLDRIANIQRAQAVAELGRAFSVVGDFVKETAKKFTEADPEMARTLENVAQGMDSMASAATLAAQGFAVGGPFGAAIGALTGVILPDLRDALDDMTTDLSNVAAAEQRAAEAAALLAAAQTHGTQVFNAAFNAANHYQEETEDLTESLDKQTAAIERRNKVLEAEDAANSKERDVADAAAIRAGAAPEDVQAKRTKDDAELAKKAKIQGLEDRRDSERENLDSSAKGIGKKIAGSANRNPTLQGIGKKLADGTNQAELDRLAAEFATTQKEMGGSTAAALAKMLAALKSQAETIRAIESQIKIARTGR